MPDWKPKAQVIAEKLRAYLYAQIKNLNTPADLTDAALRRLADIVTLMEFLEKHADDF